MKELQTSIDSLKCEMANIVSNSENSRRTDNGNKPSAETPLLQNCSDIPNYDNIDIIEVAQVHADSPDDSVTSIDEFVPEVSAEIALNCDSLTNHLL